MDVLRLTLGELTGDELEPHSPEGIEVAGGARPPHLRQFSFLLLTSGPVLAGTISCAAWEHLLSDTAIDLGIVPCFGDIEAPITIKTNLQFQLILPILCSCCCCIHPVALG